jgi:2-methylcitrate dehydratase PrpD
MPIGAQMNVGYAVAVAILDGAAMVRQFSPQRIDEDDVWALIPKIKARHEPEFDKGGPLARGNTRLKVFFHDGSMLETFRKISRTIAEPLTNDAVVAKFRTLTDAIVVPKRQAAIIDRVLNLDKVGDAAELASLLAARVEPAF